MNVLIENYRGFEIIFNTDSERFSFTLDEGHWNEKQSYAACKSNIDDFLKRNQEFSPFWAHAVGNPSNRYKIIGLRKDGRFAAETPDGKKIQISEYEEERYILLDESNEKHYAAIAIIQSEIDELKDKIQAQYAKITSPTLKKIKSDFSLLNNEPAPEVSDTRDGDSSN